MLQLFWFRRFGLRHHEPVETWAENSLPARAGSPDRVQGLLAIEVVASVLPFTSISPESFVVLFWGLGWAAEGQPCRESKYWDRHYAIAFGVWKRVWPEC